MMKNSYILKIASVALVCAFSVSQSFADEPTLTGESHIHEDTTLDVRAYETQVESPEIGNDSEYSVEAVVVEETVEHTTEEGMPAGSIVEKDVVVKVQEVPEVDPQAELADELEEQLEEQAAEE